MQVIDFGQIPTPQQGVEDTEWEPPRHVFFGKRDERGRPEKEPASNTGTGPRAPFPSMVYGLMNGNLTARIVHSQAEKTSLGAEWKDSPESFNFVGAPDFETANKLKADTTLKLKK